MLARAGARLAAGARVLSTLLLLSRSQLLLLANVMLQFADGSITFLGIRHGLAEGNPLIAGLMGLIGIEAALVASKLVALAGLAVLYRCRRHPLVEPGLASLAIFYTVFSIVPWTALLATIFLV
jgi:hypothetical protein